MMDRYIRLVTFTELERPIQRAWLRTVRDNAPNGVVLAVPDVDNDGEPQQVVMVAQELGDGRHGYCVPLARDLLDHEVAKIANAFAARETKLDFDVDTSKTDVVIPQRQTLPFQKEEMLALSSEIAKRRHEAWVRERTDAGWCYGVKVSGTAKTHPLIRPWEELPERFRRPDLAAPQEVMRAINGHGLTILDREAVEHFLARIVKD